MHYWRFVIIYALTKIHATPTTLPPRNVFLADTPWPITHQNNYATQASLVDTLNTTRKPVVDTLFRSEVAGTLTVLYSADQQVVWGSSLRAIFKVDRSGSKLNLIDAIPKNITSQTHDVFRGIYSVLTSENIFYSSVANTIGAYTDEIENKSKSKIRPLGQFVFDAAWPDEAILAVSITYDGYITFVTNKGRIGVVSKESNVLIDIAYPAFPEDQLSVTNSIALDEFGGIYMVSSRYMHRLFWDGQTKQLHGAKPSPNNTKDSCVCNTCKSRMCNIWSVPYNVESEPILGRPTQHGSGTTPTLLQHDGKLFVTIADGSAQQNLLVLSAESGELIASAPVNFESNESYTEQVCRPVSANHSIQSVVAYNGKLLVTQNALTMTGHRINHVLSEWEIQEKLRAAGAPNYIVDNVFLFPVVLGDSPRGYQQFSFNPALPFSQRLRTSWLRTTTGCPNSIPTLSLLYCVGKSRLLFPRYHSENVQGFWSIDALDWNTGKLVKSVITGKDLRYNSLYAAVQIGAEGEIIHGSIGGLVRIKRV